MPKNEDGEFELVLGNRQLLSVFFIVVILFGVFFSMGYIVGRNSGSPPVSAVSPGGTAPPEAASAESSEPPPRPSPLPAGSPEPAAGRVAEPPPPQVVERPAPEPAAPAAESKRAAAEAPARPAAPPPAPAAVPASGGLYLQVAAVGRAEADVEVAALKKRGFPATVSPGPNNLFRVLVGPYPDMGAVGRTKADLENLGFKPIVRKL
ncbi:MAG: SPOR domain-containing protein [Bryobacterales bacterium]|nr:SPOR domain-containing protein [Bryobacterales bacterium]